MPRQFTKCIKSSGKVRTIKPNAGTHMPVCFKNGKSYAGEVKKTKRNK